MKISITLIILATCSFFSVQAYAQGFIPNELTSTEKELAQQVQKMIDEINDMPLLSDTIMEEVYYTDTGILYFDKQGQLRKYFSKVVMESEGGQTVAYYNKDGNLIYLELERYSHCDDQKEYYFVLEERVIYGYYHYECGCCDGDGTESGIDTTWVAKNTIFTETVDETTKNYINANSLLDFLQSPEGAINVEHRMLLPGTIPLQKNEFVGYYRIGYYEKMKSLTAPFIIRDSIDNPKTYFLQYKLNGVNEVAVKNVDKDAIFLIVPFDGKSNDYSIERLNINGIINDELIIIRKKHITDPPFSEQISDIAVWNLDSLSCLLYIRNKYVSQHINHEFVVDLDKERLSIQKVKNGILGLTYKYKLTELGFVLDSVER